MLLLIVSYALIVSVCFASSEPCDTLNFIDDWKRSVAYLDTADKCDNLLEPGWYRITSGAGERMPTSCPVGGFRCNTIRSIYLNKDAVPPGEDVYPDVGETVNRTALSANFDGTCSHTAYDIQIKGCDGYLVYYLVPTRGCVSAYCFGDQLPCEAGTHSETGFTPGCSESPNVTVSPYVKPLLWSTSGIINGVDNWMTAPAFECYADDLVDDYVYQVRWYVNDLEMEEAKATDLSKSQVENGEGRMLEEHWKTKFKPNMLVNCSIQVGGNGYPEYGPEQVSDIYFAGLKVLQSSDSGYTVKEGETIQIPIQLTMPLACSWPKFLSTKFIKIIMDKNCVLVILNGLPEYQKEKCQNGITPTNVAFESENCGVVFNYKDWDTPRLINITGSSDGMISKDRTVLLRLYNADSVSPSQSLSYWKNIHLPDIKVTIIDSDVATLGTACQSYNDPHMRTFDGKYWELQSYLPLPQGEYIMYKHDRLPLQVTARFQECYTWYPGILCNCGVAVRSGDSVFVANYCETMYNGQRRVNRYRVQRLCDDQSLIVEKTSYSYTITLPTGTKVTFSYGNSWIDGIRIIPSILDYDLTSGVCGRYNHNPADDFTPRGQLTPVTSNKVFAESWVVQGAHADETLFDPEGKLKQTLYNGQQYCSCVSSNDNYPHDSPEYNCNLTTAMELCRKSKTSIGVFSAKCANHARKKRAVLDRYMVKREAEVGEVEDDDLPPMYPLVEEENTQSATTFEWTNGWTETSARQHCESKFTEAPAYDVCTEYVPFIDPEPYIESCILDIKNSGGDDWTKITIRNYASSCLQESRRLENLTTTNSTNSTGFSKSIAEIVAESTCFENCSNNGICIEGECQCFSGYFGDLCSDSKSKAPTVISDAFEDTCDISIRPCNNILFPATGIIDSPDLKCKRTLKQIKLNEESTEVKEKETTVHGGTYFNDLYAKCPLHGTRRKRSTDDGVVATAYVLSISNDGQNYSETVITIVFDSTCYSCNSTTLTCVKKVSDIFLSEKDICEAKAKDDELPSITGLAIGAACGAVILIIVVTVICIKLYKSKQKDQYIRDSFVSLPDTGRKCTPPKTHYVTNKDIFLSDRFRAKATPN